MVKKKPTVSDHEHLGGGGGSYTLPTASAAVLGGVKVGSRLSIAAGVLSADVQAADFTDLGDVPASYAGQGGKAVSVKADASGLEFTAPGAGVLEMQVFS